MIDNTPRSNNASMAEMPEAMLEEAAIWQGRLRDANSDTTGACRVRADFNRWLLADARHRQAFAEMEFLWGALEIPVEQWMAEYSAIKSSAVSKADSPPALTAGMNESFSQAGRNRFSRVFFSFSVTRLAAAACLLLALFATAGWQQGWVTQWQSDHYTVVGEEMLIETDDGSRITLNTDSALTMDYNAGERSVRLLKGEAWFNVAATDKRPFVVSTDAGEVRVTGTRFNVRLTGHSAVVSLDEGRVELQVSHRQHSVQLHQNPIALEPGQQAVLADNTISAPVPFDRTAVSAWLRGQFVFYNTPLAEVVSTLNRYRYGRVVVASRELGALKVSGVFSTENPDAVLQVIADTLPIQQTRMTNYLVIIH